MPGKLKWTLVVVGAFCFLIFAGAAGATQYFKQPQACANCHVTAKYVASWEKSEFLDNAHAKAKDKHAKAKDKPVVCQECHVATTRGKIEELITTARGTHDDPLKEIEYKQQQLCVDCHPADEVLEATKDYKYGEITFNPHKSHFGEMECRLCHKVHRAQVNFCETCHVNGYPEAGREAIH